jgi:hypothetical protein
MTNVIKFEDLPVEALTEVAKESFEEALLATEKALEKQLEFGRVMLIVKSKLPYGEWGNWVRETFQDQMSLRNIQFHMKAHQEVAKNPSLLECANSLDEILTLTEKPRKPAVEVIEVAAELPPPQSLPVTTGAVVATKPAKYKGMSAIHTPSGQQNMLTVTEPATANAKPEVEKKSPTVIQIQRTLMKMGADKKRHPQLMQIATDALYRLTPEECCEVLTSQVKRLTPEQRGQLIETLHGK